MMTSKILSIFRDACPDVWAECLLTSSFSPSPSFHTISLPTQMITFVICNNRTRGRGPAPGHRRTEDSLRIH